MGFAMCQKMCEVNVMKMLGKCLREMSGKCAESIGKCLVSNVGLSEAHTRKVS